MDEMNTVGTLYIVATPIGNARDMTERGRQILETADIIAAEDTRRSVVLLNKLGIRGNQLSANHKFNEYGKARASAWSACPAAAPRSRRCPSRASTFRPSFSSASSRGRPPTAAVRSP